MLLKNITLLLLGMTMFANNSFAAVSINSANAESRVIDSTQQPAKGTESRTENQTKLEADRWGLTVEDYNHYQDLMKLTPSGKWYTQLDPAEVLAINAKDDNERQRYAEIVVRTTHDRVEKELIEQHAYDAAWQKLYPNLQPIGTNNGVSKPSKITLSKSDQIIFFTNLDNKDAGSIVSQLITIVQKHAGATLAIFIVGENIPDKAIQQWAQTANIPLGLVQKHIVVLDHDNGKYAKLSNSIGTLPAIIINTNGSFRLTNLDALNL